MANMFWNLFPPPGASVMAFGMEYDTETTGKHVGCCTIGFIPSLILPVNFDLNFVLARLQKTLLC